MELYKNSPFNYQDFTAQPFVHKLWNSERGNRNIDNMPGLKEYSHHGKMLNADI